ncbi:hypothetical protein ABVT39_002112 [Epinephelus coioides]
MTNLEGQQTEEYQKEITKTELRGFFCLLLLLAGVYRSWGESPHSLWEELVGRPVFHGTMSRKRFELIAMKLRFIEKLTQPRRLRDNKLAAIWAVREPWVQRLALIYNPGADVCVDKQLVAFKGSAFSNNICPANRPEFESWNTRSSSGDHFRYKESLHSDSFSRSYQRNTHFRIRNAQDQSEEDSQGSDRPDLYDRAWQAVLEGQSIRGAAKYYDLCNVSFLRYIRKQNDGKAPSLGYRPHNKMFSAEREARLIKYLVQAADIFFGVSPKEVRSLAYQLAKQHNCTYPKSWDDHQMAGKDWFANFMDQSKSLSIRQPQATSLSWATSFNRANVGMFFENLSTVMERYHFQAKDIWNVDETDTNTVQVPDKVVASRGRNQVGAITSAEEHWSRLHWQSMPKGTTFHLTLCSQEKSIMTILTMVGLWVVSVLAVGLVGCKKPIF